MTNNKTVGEQLDLLIFHRKIQITDLAKRAGVSRGVIYKMLNDKPYGVRQLNKVAKALDHHVKLESNE